MRQEAPRTGSLSEAGRLTLRQRFVRATAVGMVGVAALGMVLAVVLLILLAIGVVGGK